MYIAAATMLENEIYFALQGFYLFNLLVYLHFNVLKPCLVLKEKKVLLKNKIKNSY